MVATARVAAKHGSFNRIDQVASTCTSSNSRSAPQMAHRSIHPFLRGSVVWPAHGHISDTKISHSRYIKICVGVSRI